MKTVWVVTLLVALGCQSGPARPEEPVWGKQACGHCMMLVSEKPPSAQAVLKDGSRKFFDDVGCLAAWEASEHLETSATWVRGPGGAGWVDAHTAHFSTGNTTPMDFGFLAAATGVGWDGVVKSVAAKANRRPGEQP